MKRSGSKDFVAADRRTVNVSASKDKNNNKLTDMLSVSGRTNYSTQRIAKHCNIRYLKEQPRGLHPYLNINEIAKIKMID
jgi:hypothetical protein